LFEGSCPLRVLNRKLGFNFPLDGPKTINGFCSSTWKIFPAGVGLKIADYRSKSWQVQDHDGENRAADSAESLA